MSIGKILSAIDAEIATLQQARTILGGAIAITPKAKSSVKGPAKKHTMSAEARAKIAEAQRKRWAAQKKAAK